MHYSKFRAGRLGSNPPQPSPSLAPGIPEHHSGRVQSWNPHDPAPRVRAGAAQVEVLDRGPVAGELGGGAEREELVERHLPLEDEAFRSGEYHTGYLEELLKRD